MLNLRKLKTSLTKHGAHKIAWLLRDFQPQEVLSKLNGVVTGINIDAVQAHKNLSVDGGVVPSVWAEAKKIGPEAINGLVLVGIIFSHHELIAAMRQGAQSDFKGRIIRAIALDHAKAYTDFAHILEELGFGKSHFDRTEGQLVAYNLSSLFKIEGFGKLATRLIGLKLKTAGWDGKGSVLQLMLANNFHQVFAASDVQFKEWVEPKLQKSAEKVPDAEFFLDTPGSFSQGGKYKFTPGHNPKATGSVDVRAGAGASTADLVHNDIQNKFFLQLVRKYGKTCVGCEIPTGYGTRIDVVVETATARWFYEIKVAETVKACIRQAIPQLLEYAYWDGKERAPDRLVIVATHELDADSRAYLGRLRAKFKLPLYYHQFVDL